MGHIKFSALTIVADKLHTLHLRMMVRHTTCLNVLMSQLRVMDFKKGTRYAFVKQTILVQNNDAN